jgi:hypothetical protein
LAWLGAARLARPRSRWARRRYGPERLARATKRAVDFDKRWDPIGTRWEDWIGGTPSQPNPAAPGPPPPDPIKPKS